MLVERPGLAVLRIAGADAGAAFQHEGGGHRWQRAHEGMVHVTVLPEPAECQVKLRRQDLQWQTTPGGALARAVGVIITHPPSGITVCCDGGRSEQQNRELALALLRARLFAVAGKRQQPGGRPIRRTLSQARGEVHDRVLDRCWPLTEYLLGEW